MEIHISIAPEVLFMVGPVHVTNSLLTMFIVMGFLLIGGAAIARSAKSFPAAGKASSKSPPPSFSNLSRAPAVNRFGRRIFPLIGGVFIFIAVANYSGVLPGVGTIGFYHTEPAVAGEASHEGEEAATSDASHEGDEAVTSETTSEGGVVVSTDTIEGEGVVEDEEHADEPHRVLVPLFRAPNADLNMTLALALVTFTTVQVLGIRAHGVGGRIKHMADPPFLFPIEVVSEVGRIISLSARLFGNVFAGEVLLGVMYALANAVKIAIIPCSCR